MMTGDRPAAITFADWREAAKAGYVAGGMGPNAAAAIVAAAADDMAALITREPSDAMPQTFIAALDLECGRYVRRNGAASFVSRQ